MSPTSLDLTLSLILGGLHAGSLLFVSLVSARLITRLATLKHFETLRILFPIWWPYGRDLMAPLNILAAIAYIVVYMRQGGVEHLVGAVVMAFVMGYTGVVMGEDIGRLRRMKEGDVGKVARSFCRKHHVRTATACVSFAWVCWKRSKGG